MFRGMGQQYAGLLLACIGFCIVPLPFVFFKCVTHFSARLPPLSL